MRFIPALALLGAAAIGTAQYPSFDLVYVTDSGDNTIKRFDGNTGTYLGTIGAESLFRPRGIAIVASSRSLWVADDILANSSPALREFDLHTGIMRRSFTIPWDASGIEATPTRVIAVAANGTAGAGRMYSYSGSLIRTIALPNVPSDIHFTRGLLLVGYTNAAVLSDFSFTDSAFGTVSTQPLLTTSRGIGSFGVGFEIVSTTDQLIYTGRPVNGINTPFDLGAGHAHAYISGKLSSNPARGVIGRWDYSARQNLGFSGSDYLIDPTYVAVLAAPEPGTLLALAGGAALLALRRRRRS